jgi:phage terminase large subunit-like protein
VPPVALRSYSGLGNAAKRSEDNSAGPWTRWKGSRVGRFIRFAETYLRPARGATAGQTIKLLKWQKEFADEYMADGVSAAVLGMGRGGGKSTFIAALAVWDLFEGSGQGAPVVPIVAASLNQAKTAVYSQCVAMVQSEPELSRRSLSFSGIGSEALVVPRTRGQIIPRSADPKTLQGLDIWPGGYVDEIGHITQATWDAILLGRKRKGARVLGAGTWGPDTTSPLYQLRKMVREGNAPDDFLWRIYSGAPGAQIADEANWRQANPSLAAGLPAIEFLRNAVVMSPEAAFRTYHLNEPDVTGHDSWLGPDAVSVWRALEDPWELEPGRPTYVGIDIGLTRDCTAVVCLQERPDGRLHAAARIWTPQLGREVDLMEVVKYIYDLTFTYQVKAVSYDPRFFELEAIRLEASRVPMVKIPQSMETMTPIVSELRSKIVKGQLSHDPDEVFGAHVVNAVARPTERGYTLWKSKSAPRGHIDACVALALAVDRYDHKKSDVGVFVGSLG